MKKNKLLIVTAAVLVVVIVLLYGVGLKNLRGTKIDLSEAGVLSTNETVQNYLATVETSCTLSYVTDGINTDIYVEETAKRMASANKNIKFERISLSEGQLRSGNAELAESSVIVTGLREMVVNYSDLYHQDGSYTSTGAVSVTEYELIAEQVLAEAVDYVTRQDVEKVYVVGTLPDGFKQTLADSMREAVVLDGETIPEDAAAVIVYDPQEDIAQTLSDALTDYISGGGTVLLYTNYEKTDWPVLDAFTESYGMQGVIGLVLESDADHIFTTEYPYLFVAEAVDTTLTGGESVQLVFPLSSAMEQTENVPDGVTVQVLYTTTESAYRKPDITAVASLEKEANDVDGAYNVAMMASKDGGNLIWFASTDMVLDDADSYYAGGANTLYVATALDTLTGTIPASAVEDVDTAKNLMAQLLSFEGNQKTVVTVVLLGLPVCVLALCLVLLPSRKKKK